MSKHQNEDIYGQIRLEFFLFSVLFQLSSAVVAVVYFTVCTSCSASCKAKRKVRLPYYAFTHITDVRWAVRVNSAFFFSTSHWWLESLSRQVFLRECSCRKVLVEGSFSRLHYRQGFAGTSSQYDWFSKAQGTQLHHSRHWGAWRKPTGWDMDGYSCP